MKSLMLFSEHQFYLGCHPWSGVEVFFDSYGWDGNCHTKLDVIRNYVDFSVEIIIQNTPVVQFSRDVTSAERDR